MRVPQRLIPVILCLFLCVDAIAQCSGINTNACSTAAPTVVGNSITCTPPANQGGRRNFLVTNMIAGATYRASNCGSGYDTQMTIRDASGNFMAYNDDNGPDCWGTAASIDFTPTTTGDYRIHLNRYNCSTLNRLNGDIVVTLISLPPPANDTCATAISLTVNSSTTCVTSTSGTTAYATQSISAISCGGYTGSADDDVWYSFTATSTEHDITVTPGTLNDLVVDLRSGACNGSNIACADATVGSNPEVINATGLTPGNTYYVRVYSYGNSSNSGTFDICVTTPTPIVGVCQPTTASPDRLYIDEVAFLGTLQDVTNSGTSYSTGYQDYTGLATLSRQVEGEGVNVYVEGNFRCRWKAWVDWNGDDIFDETTEKVYDTNGIGTTTTTFGFVIPLGTPAGNYRLRVRNYSGYDYSVSDYTTSYDYNACENFTNTGSTIDRFGEAEDYLFTVEPFCDALIDTITEGETCGPGTVDLSVTSTVLSGFVRYRWYDAETGGTMLAETNSGNWTTPSISATTTYYVTVYNGTCESWVREPIRAMYNPAPTLTVTPDVSDRVVCGENDMLEITASGDVEDVYLINEDFESGGLGVFSNIVINDNGATVNARSNWQNQESTFIPSEEVWFPAISSGFGSDHFVLTNSDVGADGSGNSYITHNALQSTSSYDTTNFENLTLSFDCYYSHYLQDGVGGADDYFTVEVSTDGSSWTAITSDIIADVGIGTKFENLSYDLSAYINQPALSVRIRFYALWSDGVAVDNVKLFGDKDVTEVDWTTTPIGVVNLFVDTNDDGIGDTPYVTGSYATVYAMPTLAQLENATYSFTIDANLANGCGSVSYDFDITNKTRIFEAPLDNWGDATNWLQGQVPTSEDCVIIKNNPLSIDAKVPASAIGLAKNLTIKSGAYLEMESSSALQVTDWINIESGGTLDIKNGANLVQITDVATNNNTGNINMQRAVSGVTASDYIYWSTPVEGFDVANVSPGTAPYYIYQWVPTVNGNGVGNYGEWQIASGNMIPGGGCIIRGISGTTTPGTVEFVGVPNNGIISQTISRGTYTGADYAGPGSTNVTAEDDNWNLIGNPYPSAISADTFLSANAASLSGTIYLWRHLSAPSNSYSDAFYSDYYYNYNEDDYIQYNSTGSNPAGFSGYIGAGQAFFVLMDDAAPTTTTVQFNNTMRGASFDNNQFYRPAGSDDTMYQAENTQQTNEKHRIWLDIIDPNNTASSTLIGYISGATNGKDKLFDGDNLSYAATTIYSLIDEDKLAIQGRNFPFVDSDEVRLGITVSTPGNYRIAINAVDGLFENTQQNIYIEDTYSGETHNLRLSPFLFHSETGTFDDRFILKYVSENANNTLSVEDFDANADVIITTGDRNIKVRSYNSNIDEITIHDILGKRLIALKNLNQETYDVSNLRQTNSTLIVKVTLQNGKQKIQKIIY